MQRSTIKLCRYAELWNIFLQLLSCSVLHSIDFESNVYSGKKLVYENSGLTWGHDRAARTTKRRGVRRPWIIRRYFIVWATLLMTDSDQWEYVLNMTHWPGSGDRQPANSLVQETLTNDGWTLAKASTRRCASVKQQGLRPSVEQDMTFYSSTIWRSGLYRCNGSAKLHGKHIKSNHDGVTRSGSSPGWRTSIDCVLHVYQNKKK